MDIQIIKDLITKSLNKLWQEDKDLITRKVREEAINHRFAIYLEQFCGNNQEIKNYFSNFHHRFHIDLEYDKNYSNPKYIVSETKKRYRVRPDILIHYRQSDKNLIAFELKKNYSTSKDFRTIKGLLRPDYNFEFGCLIAYQPDSNTFKVMLITLDKTNNRFNQVELNIVKQ